VLDEGAYLTAAEQLARGEGFPGTFRPPGYPAFMAFSFLIGAGTLGVRLLQVALSMVSVWSTYRLGYRFGGPSVARAAATIVAFDPVLIAFTHRLWSETLFIAILLVVVDLLTAEGVSWRRVVLAGLLLGLGALVRPMILTFVPFLALWFIGSEWKTSPYSRGTAIARGLGRTVVFTAAALALIAPWTARNARVSGTFVLIDSNGAFNLLVGAEPASRFVDKDDRWSRQFGAVDGSPYVALVESDPRRAQRGAMAAAWMHIRSDLSGFVAKSVWEAAHLWTLDSFLLRHLRNGWYRISVPSWAVAGVTIVSVAFSAMLCLTGVAGLVLSSGTPTARLGLLLLVHSTLLFGATYALSRYAVPLRPVLALGAASVLTLALRDRWRVAARWQRATLLSAWVFLAVSWIRDVPLLADMVSHRGASHRFTYLRDAGSGGSP
jgi:4-amino-4-deoxy-L-arabinose transferase-like glycosyltransferase